MKKLKMKLAALLAAGLIIPSLSGCTINIVEKTLDDVVIGDPDKKPDEGGEGQGDEGEHGDKPVTVPTVISVTLNKQNLNMDVNETGVVSATVSVAGGAVNTVTWSVSSDCVAITPNGNTCSYRAVKPGVAMITARANADPTKQAMFSIIVNETEEDYQGFDDSWLEEGFTYCDGFPVEEIEEFIGDGYYEIVCPSTMEGNSYWCEVSESDDSAACFVVITDGVIYEDYAYDLLDAGFEKVFYDDVFYGYEGIDPTDAYTVVAYSDMDEDTYEDIAPTFFQFYRTEDVWFDGTLTTDTSWNLNNIGEDSIDYENEIKEVTDRLPFVAMGENYEINYVDNSWYALFGYDMPNEVIIGDYSYDDSILDDYDTILMDAGFEECYDEYYQEYYFEGNVDGLILNVSYYFGSLGNTIYVTVEEAPLEAWPADQIADFIENNIGSKYTVPAYEETEGAGFYYSEQEYYVSEDSEETIMVAEVTVDYALLEEMIAYGEKLSAAGFDYEYFPETDEEYPSIVGTKGKIVVYAYLEQTFVEDTEEFLDEGSIIFQIYGDDTVVENPGLYYNGGDIKLAPEETKQIELQIVDLGENPEISYVSNNLEVCTVSETGLVSAVGIGETTIVVSTTVETVEYKVEINVSVAEAPDTVTDTLTLGKLGLSGIGTTYKDFSGITDVSGAVYAGQCAGDHESIQIRSKNSNSGIICTKSAGKIQSITIKFNSSNPNSNGLNIYASNTAYTSASELFSSTPLTKITQSSGSVTYTFTEDYAYFGIASSSGAYYIDSIEVVWAK